MPFSSFFPPNYKVKYELRHEKMITKSSTCNQDHQVQKLQMSEKGLQQSGVRKGVLEVLAYVWEYQTYADALRTHSQSLKHKQSDVQRKVDDARSISCHITEQVINWLHDTNKELKTIETLLGSHPPFTSYWNLACDCNCMRRYAMAIQAESHSKEIKKLMERCTFEGGVSFIPPLTPTTPFGYISVASREKYLERTMQALVVGDKRVIGLYGVNDVGKTMFVKNLALAIQSRGVLNGFCIVWGIMKESVLSHTQVIMAQHIGLTLTLDSVDKASLLRKKLLSMGKVLIIIENLESKIDLNKIGIPWPDSNNECRIMVVSRSLDVCKEMKAEINVEIEQLCQEEALYLFDGIAKENNFTNTTFIQQAREGILSKYMWVPGDIEKLIDTSHNKLLLPAKSIITIEASANKTLLLGAEALSIQDVQLPQFWRWLAPNPSTSSLKVAELIIFWRIHIAVQVREEWLSPATNYVAYLIYQLTPRARGFNNAPIEISLGNKKKTCYLEPSTTTVPKRRKDGWMEMELGSFFNVGHSGAVVDLLVKEENMTTVKSGLLVQGFELRPLD